MPTARCCPPTHCSPSAFRQAALPPCRRRSARMALWTIRSTRWTRRLCGSRSPDRSTPSTFRRWPPNSNVRCPLISRRRRTTIGRASLSALMSTIPGQKSASPSQRQRRNSGSTLAASSQWGGGVQLGFDYMLPSRVVLGVAADMSSGGTKTTTISDPSGISANQTTVFDSETISRSVRICRRQRVVLCDRRIGLVQRPIRPDTIDRALNSATAGRTKPLTRAYGMDCGRRHRLRLRSELERFCRVSLHKLWTSTFSLPLSQLTTTTTTTVSTVELGMNYKFNSSGQFSGVPRRCILREHRRRRWSTNHRLQLRL